MVGKEMGGVLGQEGGPYLEEGRASGGSQPVLLFQRVEGMEEERRPSQLTGFLGSQGQWTFEYVSGQSAWKEELPPKDPGSPEQKEASPEKHADCCSNQFCREQKGLRRVREAKNQLMCRVCADNYLKGQHCEYCDQVYYTQNEKEDDK
jgi:hypothetical protein